MHVSALPSRAHVSGPAFEGPRGARDAEPCSDGRCGARRRLQAPAPEGIQVRESVVKHLEPAECASPPLWSSGDPHACTPVGSARARRRNLHGTREEVRVREDWNRSSGPPDRGSPQMRGGGFHCWAGRSEPLFMQMTHRYMWRTVSGDGAADRPGAALPHCGTARIHTQARLAGAARTRRRLRHRAGKEIRVREGPKRPYGPPARGSPPQRCGGDHPNGRRRARHAHPAGSSGHWRSITRSGGLHPLLALRNVGLLPNGGGTGTPAEASSVARTAQRPTQEGIRAPEVASRGRGPPERGTPPERRTAPVYTRQCSTTLAHLPR